MEQELLKLHQFGIGPGTVKLTILNSEFNKASDLLVNNVQTEICPDLSEEGLGLAPIGHTVTVVTVDEKEIAINAKITTNGEITIEDLKENIEKEVNNYLLELRKEWEDSNSLIVRKARIEALILNIEGVLDVSNVTLNGGTENISLKEFEVPVLKEVVIE